MTPSKYTRNADGHFVCSHCGKVTEKQNTMHYHLKTHEKENHKYECSLCDDHPKFMQKSSYYHHLATAHPENPHPDADSKNPYAGLTYTCSCCDHSSHTKANTLIHYARNHCKAWIPAFTKGQPCSGCSNVFESSSAYLYHALKCFERAAPTDYSSALGKMSTGAHDIRTNHVECT
jgi:hypothetical protein